ncbi:hypothetical protein [Priestia aryabhattai]|uniref:hypothetical protein n=1 Tax=Priestia aryabhattai TaxID=412384 RepID=UPI0020D264C8|nr:hypothetical protein [Priestia aryabhattai]
MTVTSFVKYFRIFRILSKYSKRISNNKSKQSVAADIGIDPVAIGQAIADVAKNADN